MLILSLFPGIDLFGRGFESAAGWCVVRGPDLLYGGDVREFHPPPYRFEGVIGGPPCQEFSGGFRGVPTGASLAMLQEFARVVTEARPLWYLLENVPSVPDVRVAGYSWQRFNLNANQFGTPQNRLRAFQWGHCRGVMLPLDKLQCDTPARPTQPCCLASEGRRPATRRPWAEFCALQGLPRNFDLPGLTQAAKYQAVGNGVHIGLARSLAQLIQTASAFQPECGRVTFCACGCGRGVTGHALTANAACRKRVSRARKTPRSAVTL